MKTIDEVLTRMRMSGLTIFRPTNGASELDALFKCGSDYTNYAACKVLEDSNISWKVIGCRVPIVGLSKIRTTKLLIQSELKTPVELLKSKFEVVL